MTFDDAEMDDEPEMADEEDAHTTESVYVLADRYRMAKKVLQTENADPVEKSAACRELEQLWEKGYSSASIGKGISGWTRRHGGSGQSGVVVPPFCGGGK